MPSSELNLIGRNFGRKSTVAQPVRRTPRLPDNRAALWHGARRGRGCKSRGCPCSSAWPLPNQSREIAGGFVVSQVLRASAGFWAAASVCADRRKQDAVANAALEVKAAEGIATHLHRGLGGALFGNMAAPANRPQRIKTPYYGQCRGECGEHSGNCLFLPFTPVLRRIVALPRYIIYHEAMP